MRGTIVSYNGVTLHNVRTLSWDQEVRYDASGTDAMFHTFRMRFEGLLHTAYHNDSIVSVSGDSHTTTMPVQYEAVHRAILRTREQLLIYVTRQDTGENLEIFRCDPAPGGITGDASNSPANAINLERDVDNGPKPKAFRIIQVIGGKCLRVQFEIECSKLICPSGVYNKSGAAYNAMPVVLSNRWSVEESMDENMFTTRNIAGKLRLSTNLEYLHANVKYLTVPGLEDGFRRANIDFSTDKTGLECDYRITDRQVHTSAPWPATKMNVRHTQSTNDGLNMTSEVYVELEGSPAADKKELFARAMQIIDAKLNFKALLSTDSGVGTKYIPEAISFTDYIGDSNRVEAVARFLEIPQDLDTTFANLRKNLGKPLELPAWMGVPYDPGNSIPPAIYGYNPPQGTAVAGSERRPAVLLLLQCYLQQPCLDVHSIARWGTLYEPAEEEDDEHKKPYEPTQVNEQEPGYLPEPPGEEWSQSAKSSVYTYVRACTKYIIDKLRVGLPVASSGGGVKTAEESRASISAGGGSSNPADSCRVFSLGPAQCRRIIDYDAERAGALPEMPAALDSYRDGENDSIRATLLRHSSEAYPPSLTSDGVTKLYRLSVHLEYALSRAPSLGESVRMGVAPQTKLKRNDTEVKLLPAEVHKNPELDP